MLRSAPLASGDQIPEIGQTSVIGGTTVQITTTTVYRRHRGGSKPPISSSQAQRTGVHVGAARLETSSWLDAPATAGREQAQQHERLVDARHHLRGGGPETLEYPMYDLAVTRR